MRGGALGPLAPRQTVAEVWSKTDRVPFLPRVPRDTFFVLFKKKNYSWFFWTLLSILVNLLPSVVNVSQFLHVFVKTLPVKS